MMISLSNRFQGFVFAALVGGSVGIPGISQSQALPPLSLMSPLSSISLDGLLNEAEAAYASRNLKTAEDVLQTVLDLDSGNRRALFRLGNIAQQRALPEKATGYYRELSKPNEFSQGLDEIGEKALINIAMLSLESARSALTEMDQRLALKDKRIERKALLDDLEEAQARLDTKIDVVNVKFARAAPVKAKVLTTAPSLVEPQMIRGNMTSNASESNETERAAPKRKTRAKATQSEQVSSARSVIQDQEPIEKPTVTYLKGSGNDRSTGAIKKVSARD